MSENNAIQDLGQRKKLFQDGQVNIENLDEERQVVEATVYGTYAYDVSVGRDPDNDNCTCPYFAENGFCKHVAAVVELFKFAKDQSRRYLMLIAIVTMMTRQTGQTHS